MNHTIGTCSICGGQVTIPTVWAGIIPPTPSCLSCGALGRSFGPVIPMHKPNDSDNPNIFKPIIGQSIVIHDTTKEF